MRPSVARRIAPPLLLFGLALSVAWSSPNCAGNPHILYDGYLWHGFCVPGYISEGTWFTRAPLYSFGDAVYYAPYVMEAQAAYRKLSLDGYLDGVALMSPADLGRTVWLKRSGGEWEGPYLSLDLARRNDMYGIIVARGEVVEVGYRTAVRWGLVPGGWKERDVEVWIGDTLPKWLTDPATEYPALPVDYRQWFLDHVEFTSALRDVRYSPVAKDGQCWLFRDGERRLMCPEDWPAEPLQFESRGTRR